MNTRLKTVVSLRTGRCVVGGPGHGGPGRGAEAMAAGEADGGGGGARWQAADAAAAGGGGGYHAPSFSTPHQSFSTPRQSFNTPRPAETPASRPSLPQNRRGQPRRPLRRAVGRASASGRNCQHAHLGQPPERRESCEHRQSCESWEPGLRRKPSEHRQQRQHQPDEQLRPADAWRLEPRRLVSRGLARQLEQLLVLSAGGLVGGRLLGR